MINGCKEFIIDCYKLTVHLSVYWGYSYHYLMLTLEKHHPVYVGCTALKSPDNRNVLFWRNYFVWRSYYRKLDYYSLLKLKLKSPWICSMFLCISFSVKTMSLFKVQKQEKLPPWEGRILDTNLWHSKKKFHIVVFDRRQREIYRDFKGITSNHRTFGSPIISTVSNSQCNFVH